MAASTGRNTLVLTINQRLARNLLFKHSEDQKKSGQKVWETPQIFELRTWLKSNWLNSNPDHFILSEIQSIKIWESIIKNSLLSAHVKTMNIESNSNLLNLYSAAQQASEAYKTIREYRLKMALDPLLLNIENKLFLKWSDEYDAIILKIKAIDQVHLLDDVRKRMNEKLIKIPNIIKLNGFEEITPQLAIWLEFLKENQTKIFINSYSKINPPWSSSINIKNKNIKIHTFLDLKNESRICANWVREIYSKGQSIGIIVPEIGKYRQVLHKELITNLTPQSIFPWEQSETPFDISTGTPLSNEGMVQIALDIISVSINVLPIDIVLNIINNSYITAGRTSLINRTTLETNLKKENLRTIDLETIEPINKIKIWPELRELTKQLLKLSKIKDIQLPSFWANIFSQLLKNLGWPVDKVKNFSSREIQCLDTWNECLDEFASLDSFIGKISRADSAKELKQITSKRLFQIKTKEQPIQVLGLKDSIGITFDNIWVMGCHSDCIPAKPNPNPFIPIYLQKKHRLPHCDSTYETQYAEQALSRLVGSSNNIIFSYPEWEKEYNKQISSLLNYLPISITEPKYKKSFRVRDLIKPLDNIESWHDKLSILPSPDEIISFKNNGLQAGYKVLKNQADCPFKAFAAHRLHLDTHSQQNFVDYDARDRGILIHRVLQLFWEKYKSRDALEKLKSSDSLINELERMTKETIKTLNNCLAKQPRFLNMEIDRNVSLLTDWMDQELLRSDFTVQYTEKKETITINNLKLNLRVDRIDMDNDKKSILIDYKTGFLNTNEWFTNRIQDPQLPLYSTILSPDGIAFAHISKGSLGWSSVYNQKIKSPFSPNANVKIHLNIPEITGWPEWGSLLSFWKKQLNELAGEFSQGKLFINPIKQDMTCRNCGYKMLCRIGDNNSDDCDLENIE